MKGLAKTLAQETAALVTDRHVRAEVRTVCYNRLVDVLRKLEARHARQRARHQRTVSVLGTVTAVLAGALALSLLV